jgi:hypothetical protein
MVAMTRLPVTLTVVHASLVSDGPTHDEVRASHGIRDYTEQKIRRTAGIARWVPGLV